jgi:hypothetical protein
MIVNFLEYDTQTVFACRISLKTKAAVP